MRSLAKDPDDRFQSAEMMRQAFEAFEASRAAEPEDGSAPPAEEKKGQPETSASATSLGRVGAVAAAVALLALGGYFAFGPGDGASSSSAAGNQNESSSPPSTHLTVDTEPGGAEIFRGDERLGTAPITREVTGDSIGLRVRRAGYLPVDTTLHVGGDSSSVAISLKEEDEEPAVAEATPSSSTQETESQPQGGNGGNNDPAPETQSPSPPPQGSLTLRSAPSGTVLVDGEARSAGQSIQLSEGTHEVEFRYQDYSKDTTLTVAANASQELTCYFRHRLSVRSSPIFASVHLDGEDTNEDTPYDTTLPPGTYDVEARVNQLRGTVEGGEYRYRIGDARHRETLSGNVKTITLEPGFEQEIHIVDFQVSEAGAGGNSDR